MNEKMKKDEIIKLLSKYNMEEVDKFAAYCIRLYLDVKNPWMKKKDAEQMAGLFRRVNSEWLVFDWVHVTLQQRWINYDYVAFKNKMLISYPESIIDINLVYKDDKVSFNKDNWKVLYTHTFANPFDKWEDKIIGWYCIIKNKRWEFLTLLSEKDFLTHKNKATTKFIWNEWFTEMRLKTLFRKAIKVHYDDVFEGMELEDNKQYDLTKESVNAEEVEKKVLNKYNLIK